MNKLIVIVFLFFGIVSNCFSQKPLSEYSYVIVSEQFEFQKEKNKYELNSLTKFLFNKHGFHAFFDKEIPSNVNRCDGLWVDAEGTLGFVTTKVLLVFKDCNGVEVFRTNYGKSKEKEYKKAYYESIREAFEDIIKLHIVQKEIVKSTDSQKLSDNNKKLPVVETAIIATNTNIKEPIKKVESELENTRKLNFPLNKYTNYSSMGKTYLLRKTTIGYTLYQELIGADDDLLLIGKIIIEDSDIYFKSDNKEKVTAFFDESNNLIIGEEKEKTKYILEN